MHAYNRDGFWTGADPFDLLSQLALLASDDAPHAFYRGVDKKQG
jgi:hypothetical protein